jgi:hypothetical protein
MDDEDKNKTGDDEKKVELPEESKMMTQRDFDKLRLATFEMKRVKQAARNKEKAQLRKAKGLVNKNATIHSDHVEFFKDAINPMIKRYFSVPAEGDGSKQAKVMALIVRMLASGNVAIEETRAEAVLPGTKINTTDGKTSDVKGGASDDKGGAALA